MPKVHNNYVLSLQHNNERFFFIQYFKKVGTALAGNRTRVARVAGEHSTTEPPMLLNIAYRDNEVYSSLNLIACSCCVMVTWCHGCSTV